MRTGKGYGIELQGTCNVTVQNIEIKHFAWGIASSSTSCNNTIKDSRVLSNGDGIVLHSSDGYLIVWNRIADATFQDGIWLWNCTDARIFHNDIALNPRNGITFATDSWNNIVRENNIMDNGDGVYYGFGPNMMVHNNFINNTLQAGINPSYSQIWNTDCEGNYCNDYNGTDTDWDGVGERVYVIDSHNADFCPLINDYWNPCDINHDLKVDMKDIGVSARAFDAIPGDILWNPHADIIGPTDAPDGKVDMRDISLIARHFMEHYP